MNLSGKRIAFLGTLLYIPMSEAKRLAQEAGAVISRTGSPGDLIVIGLDGWHLNPAATGAELKSEAGPTARVITESEFLRAVGAAELEAKYQTQYTPAQLARIAGAATDEIRRWLRSGLLKPARVVNRLPWFDFVGLSHARKLKELLDSGITLASIKRAVSALGQSVQDAGVALSQLTPLYATPVRRLSDGSAVEIEGQLLLDFQSHVANDSRVIRLRSDADLSMDDLFEAGVIAEDDGDLPSAEEAYLGALREGGPDAEVCFNLGNVLYRLDRLAEASQRYLQSVEIDSDYVEAWNNLGNALASLGRADDAVQAYQQALEIEPHYADALYNLAETLDVAGRPDEARLHWFAYLGEDSDSPIASAIRSRLVSPISQET